ncbi:hypothetical protein DFP72DRAFT_407300 [Ephemerocybe angulata]|uniref:MYND-type domain-containing protein n=1 Tax=Ephemerocybe angulata TaxID=980116 RepID=A0A8H6HVT1_9AGAR|nr:hypothetical protein DFP72DRAFT_407300 [Tulosesus angulatus]
MNMAIPSHRFEVLLQGIQRGSVAHCQQLADNWPTDISQSKRALSALLAHLTVDRVPERSLRTRYPCSLKTTEPELLIIQPIPEAFSALENCNKEQKAEIYSVLRENLDGLISWVLYFDIRGPPPLVTGGAIPDVYAGPSQAAYILFHLLDYGLKDDIDNPSLALAVESALDLWMSPCLGPHPWRARHRNNLNRLSVDQYTRYLVPIVHLLWFCTTTDNCLEILVERMNGCHDRAWQRSLAESFVFRWKQLEGTTSLGVDQSLRPRGISQTSSTILLFVSIFHALHAATGIHRTLTRVGFLGTMFKLLAQDVSRYASPSGKSISVEVIPKLFRKPVITAYEATYVVARALDAGVLIIIARDILSQVDPRASPFPAERSENPLVLLHSTVYHPRVCRALENALSVIPQNTLDLLSANREWTVLRLRVKMYADVYQTQLGPLEIPLCDNLQHRNTCPFENPKGVEGLQCASCRTTMYCSRECQREDWANFHRQECAANRKDRIAREADGAWISHRMRTLLLRLVWVALGRDSDHPSDPEKIAFLDTRFHGPGRDLKLICLSTPELRSFDAQPYSIGFDDKRSRAMREEALETRSQFTLVGLIANLGDYGILGLARFYRDRGHFLPLNLYIKAMKGAYLHLPV